MARLKWPLRWPLRRRAPRRLKFTRTGKALVGLALGVGLAALNTGNNLLLLGWSMVLCAIVLSGVLSEGCLRPLECRLRTSELWRVGEVNTIAFETVNRAALLPSFAVLFTAAWAEGSEKTSLMIEAHAPYVLRLLPKARETLLGHVRPTLRGRYALHELRATTGYPFGFFIKIRPLDHEACEVVCAPERINVRSIVESLLGGAGEAPQNQAGPSDTLLSLRPFRTGDEQRRIDWRRSLRATGLIVRETERMGGRVVMLCFWPGPGASQVLSERAIATLGSLAEDLIAAQFDVGLYAPGLILFPSSGKRFIGQFLTELALLDLGRAMPALPAEKTDYCWAHLSGIGLLAPSGCLSTPLDVA